MVGQALRAAMVAGLLALAPTALVAADLPKATQKILGDTKLPESILSGLDKELKMPADWVAGAQKEKQLRIGGTWDLDQLSPSTGEEVQAVVEQIVGTPKPVLDRVSAIFAMKVEGGDKR